MLHRQKGLSFRFNSGLCVLGLLLLIPTLAAQAQSDADASGGEEANLAETGAKLSNPTSNVWALFTEFDLSFNNGNANQGDDKVGSLMNFQPVLPVPLFGEGEEQWKMIMRPAVPIQFASPRPDGINNTNYDHGLSDFLFPMLLVPSEKALGPNLIFGIGPTFVLPTSTKVELGQRQWQAGPAAVLGYKTEDYVVGVFPQYFWGIGGRGDQGSNIENASNMNLLYFGFYNLPNAWQVGMNPVITYNHKASRGNKWNAPIGLAIAKTTKIGRAPVKFQFGIEYSVVSQDDFGKKVLFKLNVIPVISALIGNPLFGGG